MTLRAFLESNGISHAKLAGHLGLTRAAVSYKINGLRPWKSDEINKVIEFCREIERDITYENLFVNTEGVA